MFHRIYESMELGMHPTSLYPRRSRVAPEIRPPVEVETRKTNDSIVGGLRLGVKSFSPLELPL